MRRHWLDWADHVPNWYFVCVLEYLLLPVSSGDDHCNIHKNFSIVTPSTTTSTAISTGIPGPSCYPSVVRKALEPRSTGPPIRALDGWAAGLYLQRGNNSTATIGPALTRGWFFVGSTIRLINTCPWYFNIHEASTSYKPSAAEELYHHSLDDISKLRLGQALWAIMRRGSGKHICIYAAREMWCIYMAIKYRLNGGGEWPSRKYKFNTGGWVVIF
ncbi:hypothetical protein BDV93DRAFT_512531 [Ceratobasidium sp. AG-I]|nr:hypothetical protein BDV93DRAFT_512531 [Ceratobasidium sp. AG-I]